MPHTLIAGKLHPAGLALLEPTSCVTYTHVEGISEETYQPYLDLADGMVIRTQPMGAASVAKATKLQIVLRHAAGLTRAAAERMVWRACKTCSIILRSGWTLC